MIENESRCVPSYKYSNLLLYNSLTVLNGCYTPKSFTPSLASSSSTLSCECNHGLQRRRL